MSPPSCMLCREQEEDCEHLFFKCPIAIMISANQGLSAITSSSVFWATIPRRRRGHEADRGKRFAVVWALWLHRNEVIFEGKAVSSEGIIHEVEKFVGFWFENGWVGGYGGHDGPCSWSRYPLPPLYDGSPLWVICFLIQKKKKWSHLCACAIMKNMFEGINSLFTQKWSVKNMIIHTAKCIIWWCNCICSFPFSHAWYVCDCLASGRILNLQSQRLT